MRLVALFTCLTLLGCFSNAKHRTYAKYVEGGMLVAGITILAVANTGADCDMSVGLGMPKSDCKSSASLISGFGLALVIGGIVGFMATVASDDKKTPTADDKKTTTTTPTPPISPPPTTPTPAPATP